MITRFADTFYFLALLNPVDEAHGQALKLTKERGTGYITTAWVLTEVADAMSAPVHRPLFLELLKLVESHPAAEIVAASDTLFRQGVSLFAQRPDKEWSLTDCISFVVMQEYGISEALTGDHHFEQAGFVALMK